MRSQKIIAITQKDMITDLRDTFFARHPKLYVTGNGCNKADFRNTGEADNSNIVKRLKRQNKSAVYSISQI